MIVVDYLLEFLPFHVRTFPIYLIIIIQLMASKGYSFIIFFMYVPSESLNLMARIATMNLIFRSFKIMWLVALPFAKWTRLATSKCLVKHIFIEVFYEVNFVKRIFW